VNYNIQKEKTIPALNVRQHLITIAKKVWWVLAIMALFSIVDIAIGLLQPWPTKVFIDSVVGNVPAPGPLAQYSHETVLLFIVTAITFALFIANSISGYIQMRIGAWVNFNIDRAIQKSLYERILGLPPDSFSKHTVGDYIYRQTSETRSVADYIIDVGLTLFESILSLSGAIIILMLINWQLGLIALIPIPVIALSLWYFNPIIERQARELREVSSKVFSFTEESINLSRLIRIFDRIPTQAANLVSLLNKNYQVGLRQRKTGYFFNFTNSIGTLLQSSVLLFVGGLLILHGHLTIGELVIFFSYVNYLTNPLHSIANTINRIKTLNIHLDKIYEIIDSPETDQARLTRGASYVGEHRKVQEHPGKSPLMTFKDVLIAKDDKPILSNVSFDIYKNEKIGFIGPSGSGKSTLFDVILGFIPFQGGQIYLNERPLEDYKVEDVRKLFSVVSQESQLLTMTIEENIAFGAPIDNQPTFQQITAAADDANATEFIMQLPAQFKTMVGDASVHLSGGQKQRLSIARSLLRDAPILILDEPTSALDKHSAKEVLHSLERLMKNRTTLFITHDLSILDAMDRVYVVKNGTVKPVEAYGGLEGYEQSIVGFEEPTVDIPSK
jgi:ATP-binding cassette subfamily B protein/subfamily B ATP-binding cassette protein MsbA